MSAEEEPDSLKLYWDHFFKSETGTYEKSTWLELFLAEFIIRLKDGADAKKLINFCPLSGVVTLVGCELLCGVHRVSSSINTPAVSVVRDDSYSLDQADHAQPTRESAGVEEGRSEDSNKPTSLFSRNNAQLATETLRRYVLAGVPWRCLLLLRALGVEGLSCCRQLSSVLIWLVGELGAVSPPTASPTTTPEGPMSANVSHVSVSHRKPIHELFSRRIWSKQKPTGSLSAKQSQASSAKSPSGRLRQAFRTKLSLDNSKQRLEKSDQSSDSGDSGDDLQVINRSMSIKVCSRSDDFDYFNLGKRSSNDYPSTLYSDPFYSPRKTKPKADDYMTDKHREIINSEIGTFEFTLIITDLLKQLCKAESSLSGSEGSQISMQCINFSLKSLCSLQFGSVPDLSLGHRSLEISRVKLALTELLIVSLDQVLIHSDLCSKLIINGILPMLLRLLEDVICKSNAKQSNKLDRQNRAKDLDISKETESKNLLYFVFGIAYSITAFFHCLLMQCRSVDKLREFTDQFKLYGECFKGGLLKECIELMIRIPVDEEEIVLLIKKLIESIGRLISAMKRVRSEVIHSAACPKSRHKACRQRVVAGMHHHHDILGEAGSGLPIPSSCCVSILYGTLVSLVPDEYISAQKILRNKILSVMLKCGVCCCLSPNFLMESIVRLMLTHHTVASNCLHLLEHTVYGDLGASVLIPRVTDQLPCSICEQSDGNRDLGRKYCSHGVSPMERKSVWSFLIHYNSLLQLDNHNDVLHATVGHLLKVTPKCRTEMKYELLFSVIYPTFIVAKHRYIMRSEETAYFLTASCLSVFASLLNTVSFAEQFIQKGGLSYVLELVALPEFSNRCCAILEIAIVVEIFKLTKENEEMTYFREMRSLASVRMLVKSLMNVTESCHNVYKKIISPVTFDELCDLTKVKEALGWDKLSGTEEDSADVCIAESNRAETTEDIIEVLKNAYTFWKCCAGLCLYSPWFRRWVSRGVLLLRSFALMRLLLHRICTTDTDVAQEREARALIKIMEALLTVQFAVADSTSGKSKVVSCAVVRKALATRAAACECPGGGGLRALCDALLAVAVARPSGRHAMPRLAPSKVPPLFCPSGGSSECSSSEDSAAGPYASENSDPRLLLPDDGYEADVEIGKLDFLASIKIKNVIDPLSALDAVTSSPNGACFDVECPEYDRHGELAHPELCVIVVDIVSQLIHGLLEEKCSLESRNKSVEELERVCAGLARAWGAGGQGEGADAAPGDSPPLLGRLLAPRAPATRLLSQHHTDLQDLQRAVLSLVVGAARRRLSACELAALLRLFTASAPPLTPLLRALQQLLAQQRPHAPDHELLFPVTLTPESDELPVDESVASSFSHQAEIQSNRLHLSHLNAGIVSPWAVGAARCGVDGAGWAPWAQGFTVVAWLQLQPPTPAKDEAEQWLDDINEPEIRGTPRGAAIPMHVFSVGHDSLMFELWTDLTTGILSVRLSRPEARVNRIVSGARSTCALPLRRTACLAFDVRERVTGRRINLHVTVYIDGRECETILLPVQGILVRKPTPVNVMFGHASAGGAGVAGTLRVASVRVYRSPVLSPPAAAHLAAHGPNQPCQVGCESPDISSIITPEILEMGLDWDQVYELPSNTLRELHEQQLLALSAHAPDYVLLYPQYSPAPTVWGGRPSGGGAGEPPRTLRCSWAGPPRVSVHRGFAPALLLLGGPDLLLYLFARVVELEGSAEEQAAALSLLLRSCVLDARLAAALHNAHSLRLLLPVFAAPHCNLSAAMLQVILSEACNAPVLTGATERGSGGTVDRKAGHVVLDVDTQALLVEPRLIKLLFRAWRNFETAQVSWDEAGQRYSGTAWGLTLACVRALLRPDHPHADFNRYQAARADLLRQLLLTTKERFLNSECGGMDEHASDCLVGVARALLTGSSAPAARPAAPALNELALLADFLLLMHQASDTFVTHTRATFYFLLSYDTPETSEFNFLKFIGKRARANFTVSENSSDLPLGDMGDTLDRSAYRDSESDKTDDSGVESTKRLKGIINKKIREDRRSISTSTSDNSDSVLEEKKELDNDVETETEDERKDKEKEVQNNINNKEDGLNGFVVVNKNDLDENVTNSTNINESSNQQRVVGGMSGVRAGAEPGWRACEGLLLLLRDALAAIPKDQLAQATTAVVQPELVAVLANHRMPSVRAAVVRVARELMRRAPATVPAPTAKLFYSLLANQISLYGVSSSLAEACCALLTDADVPLSEQLDAKIWASFADDNAMRAAPLLALLPLAIRDVPLAHNLVAVLRRFVDKVSTKTLSEVALVEVVVRAIRALGQEEQDYEGKELILEDLSDLLNRIAIKTLAGNNSMQSILDTHLLLRYIECEAGGDEGVDGGVDGEGVRKAARVAQATLYAAQLDALQQRLRRAALEPVRRPTYFTNVLSSAVERSEVADTRARIAAVQTRAVAFLTTRERDAPQPAERALFCRLLDMLLHDCSSDSSSGGRRGGASGALSDLFWWAATPSVIARPLQPDLLRALYRAPPIALAHLVPHNRDPSSLRKLAVYLLTLLRHVHLETERGGSGVELAITDWARDWAVGSQAALAERLDSEALPAEAERLRRADRARRLANASRRRAAIGKAVFAREAQARTLAEAAMAATRMVVDTQNAERKAFLEQLKASSAAAATATARWQRIVNAHTHERGVWYDEHAAPASWQLDDVEGPGRVRVRLRRAHLRIPERFLKVPYKYKAERALAPAPLRSVVGAGGGGGASARLAAGEAVQHTARVRRVTVALAAAGELLLTDRRLHWVPEEPAEPLCLPLRALAAVATRRWCLRECALELFLRSGRAHLLAFEDQAERSAFLKQLARAHLPERTEQENLTDAMNQWRVGAITNWEYLMILNGLAGRSYNDLMQYPVLPFVIADYSSKILDLTDPASFRDLSRPMAIQNRNREQHYINTYNDLAAARRDGCSPLLSRWPHHYASLYSNSGGVLHYLVRLPPFTELFLNYQDNNFDMPDRTFHSLATTWRLITNDSPTDVKELIPELFYLPELFYNNEGLELGVRQCGLAVDSVQLPQWAADARLFTLVHRQALEAPAVTERLPLWIDLVFGYKQTGQAAIDAINVFPACTYYGFDPSALEHQVDRDAADAMVRTYGQAPRQLLRQPHPQRAPDLAPPPPLPSAQVYAGAVGARWGRYCGSPERPAPREVGRRAWSGVTRLQPLAHPRSVAAVPYHTMLLLLRDEWAAPGDVENEILCAVSWGHADGLLRLRRRRDLPPEPLLQLPHIEQVTSTCGWSGGGGGEAARGAVGALGLSSGRVLALRVRGGPVPRLTALPLLAHAAPVSALALCPRAGLLASASDDGVIVLWDLDELTYIRTLPNRGRLRVQHLAISETLSDVCSAHEPPPPLSRSAEEAPNWLSEGDAYATAADAVQPDNADSDAYERDDTYKYRTLLRVHTVNGRFVGSVKVIEGVTCMQYSNAPEGASANCVAAALRSGGIRLYSSWELRPVAYIPPPNGAPAPMLSLAYGGDSSVLFSCYADGTVLAWESLDAGARPQPLRIVSAHALL